MHGRLESHGRRRHPIWAVAAPLLLWLLLVPSAAAADRDRDGLSNRKEIRLRLKPNRWDSDRDRLSDGDEVRRCRTNPRRRDTDRDRLSDGHEVLRSLTDPRHAGLRIFPCRTVPRRLPRGALFVDRDSVGGRCDDRRTRGKVSRSRPWCSLERALAAAGGGRTVLVRRGSYPSLEVRGQRRKYLTLRPFRAERVRLGGVESRDSSYLETGRYTGDAGYLRLEGFRISGPVELLFGSRQIQLIANDITSYLHLRLTRDVRIERNLLHDTPPGIRVIGADGYASNPARRGIFGLTIRGNRIERASNDAIAVYGGAYGLRIERNEIAHVLRPAGSDLHVDAIQTQGGRDITIRGNFIHHALQGILLLDALPLERLLIENNVVVRTEGWGVLLKDAPGARIVNNTVWDTGAGLGIGDTPQIAPPDTSATLRNNIIDWLQPEDLGYLAAQDHNLIKRGPSGYLDRSRWPRFRNPGRLDYRLAKGSPGIDTGTDVDAPLRDAVGARRVRGTDLGALERVTP